MITVSAGFPFYFFFRKCMYFMCVSHTCALAFVCVWERLMSTLVVAVVESEALISHTVTQGGSHSELSTEVE